VSEDSDLVHRVRPAAGEPAGALVLFHGRGADEHDLYPLLDVLDPERRLTGITPRGPFGFSGRQGGAHWYAVPRVGYPDPPTFAETYARGSAWLHSLANELGLEPARTLLGGFSQGAVMAFTFGLGQGRPRPAGIVALSGFIPTVDGWQAADDNARELPVFLAHGSRDPVIPVDFAHRARERLEEAGADLVYREPPVGHQIDPRLLPELAAFVREVVPGAR
jgi:phospholipase/carboxylesterase